MTRAEMDRHLDALQWSRAALARQTGYSERQVARWGEVPGPVAAWLERRVAGHESDPAPRSPGTNRRAA